MTLLRQVYPQFSVRYYCCLFGKSRQGWYEQIRHEQKQGLAAIIILKLVGEIRALQPRIGTRKLLHLLQPQMQEHGIKIGRDKLYKLLGFHGYLLRYRRRKPYTTDSNHPYRKYPNLIRNLVLTEPGQLWVSDITYLRLIKGFCYLSIVTDAYSRKIIGHKLHPDLTSRGAMDALAMALQSKRSNALIHHSDRGIQYCCSDYVTLLEENKINISMTEKGDPYENAIAERVNGILKTEFSLEATFDSLQQAEQAVDKAVNIYNHHRPHASCDYLTPVAAHEQNRLLRKRWKSKQQQPTLETVT